MNDIVNNDEKWGGIRRLESSFRKLKSFIRVNELIDIGFESLSWTWCNNWEEECEIKERLDRIMVSRRWKKDHRKAKCIHIQNEASDHCMLLLDTKPGCKKMEEEVLF